MNKLRPAILDHLSGKARRVANMKIIDADKPAIRPGLKFGRMQLRQIFTPMAGGLDAHEILDQFGKRHRYSWAVLLGRAGVERPQHSRFSGAGLAAEQIALIRMFLDRLPDQGLFRMSLQIRRDALDAKLFILRRNTFELADRFIC
jgi:hypothetical protein